ncbi:uncharacterized protein LOC132042046 [Lycium ferocissimum]|uniref:uncharacterized protein LOC132042046 n=1 Tax=Lycium ferocissimum TaxID=112874 RepID=UPI002814D070|nr:uncharacterized protein LOC132042046 [Lycium ferocissimum]
MAKKRASSSAKHSLWTEHTTIVQEQVVQNSPPAPAAATTIALPANLVIKLLNVSEALAPNHGGRAGPQVTSQAQAQVQLNVASNQTPQLAPQQVVQSTGQSNEFKNFMDVKPPEFDASPGSIEPQKFIDHCEKILTTLGLKETRGVKYSTFLFSGFVESWWISIQRGRQAGLPPITWSKFLQGTITVTEYEAKFTDLSRYVPFLVEDPREKVRRFVDGPEHCYRGLVPRNTGGFSGASSGCKSGFYRRKSRPTQLESVVQSSWSGYSNRASKCDAEEGQDVEASNTVVTGIITIGAHGAYALTDLYSTYSYVSPSFAIFLELGVESINVPYVVETLVGESILVDRVYRDCVISVQSRETAVDLCVLPMSAFDVIMGIDWLESC